MLGERTWLAAVVLIACAQVATLALTVGPYPHERGQRLLLALLACGPVFALRRWPLPVLATIAAANGLVMASGNASLPFGLMLGVAVYLAARGHRLRHGVPGDQLRGRAATGLGQRGRGLRTGAPGPGAAGDLARAVPGAGRGSVRAVGLPGGFRSGLGLASTYGEYTDQENGQLNPAVNEMVKIGLWLELDVGLGFMVGLGLGSLIGQRTVPIVLLVVLEIIVTPILAGHVIPHFLDGQRLVVGLAMDQLRPAGLAGAGPAPAGCSSAAGACSTYRRCRPGR